MKLLFIALTFVSSSLLCAIEPSAKPKNIVLELSEEEASEERAKLRKQVQEQFEFDEIHRELDRLIPDEPLEEDDSRMWAAERNYPGAPRLPQQPPLDPAFNSPQQYN